jgi:hypothetical protein
VDANINRVPVSRSYCMACLIVSRSQGIFLGGQTLYADEDFKQAYDTLPIGLVVQVHFFLAICFHNVLMSCTDCAPGVHAFAEPMVTCFRQVVGNRKTGIANIATHWYVVVTHPQNVSFVLFLQTSTMIRHGNGQW